MNLIELALTTYTEGAAAKTEETAALAEEARVEFLANADSCAHGVLKSGADGLNWQYMTAGLPDETEEARALLVPGRPEYLRFRVSGVDDFQVSFDLVRPCLSCGHDRIAKVTSLFHLGQLFHQDEHSEQEKKDAEPGPLAGLLAWEARSAGVSELVRRLIADHPDAGLTVSHIVSIVHHDGDGSTDVHLDAASADAVRMVAAALGAEVNSRHTPSPMPNGLVLEHVTGTARLAPTISVTVLGYSQLPDDEAAAWRAQQNQASEESAVGGEPE